MSDLFSIYEINLRDNFKKIEYKTEEMHQNTLSTKSKDTEELSDRITSSFTEIENLLLNCDKIISQMNIELSSSSLSSNEYSNKLNEYTNTLNNYKKTIRSYEEKLKEKSIKEKFNFDDNTNNLNKKLISDEKYAYSSKVKLDEAKRVLAATEDTGNKIMANMEEQTNQMKSVNVKIQGMNDNLDSSNSILGRIQGLVNKNKKIIIIFGSALFIILFFVILVKLINNKVSSKGSQSGNNSNK